MCTVYTLGCVLLMESRTWMGMKGTLAQTDNSSVPGVSKFSLRFKPKNNKV